MRDRPKSTVPKQPQLLSPPKPFDESDGWRRTFLFHVTNPLERDVLVQLGKMLDRLLLEEGSLWSDIAESAIFAEARAAAADLRYLEQFLARLGRQLEECELGADEERVSRLAARLAPRVGRMVDALGAALMAGREVGP